MCERIRTINLLNGEIVLIAFLLSLLNTVPLSLHQLVLYHDVLLFVDLLYPLFYSFMSIINIAVLVVLEN